MGTNIIFIGIIVTIGVLAAFWWSLSTTQDINHARSVALTTIVMLELARLAMIRQQYHTPALSNPWLILALTIVFILQIIVLYTPFMRNIFGTVALSLSDWIMISAIAAGTYVLGLITGWVIKKLTKQHD